VNSYGAWITLEAPIVSEMMSTLGFDYFVIDTEHVPLNIRTTQTLMQVMHPTSKTTPIVRVLVERHSRHQEGPGHRRLRSTGSVG
jgi:2-keto-3-deoxy-L-rhamnonate aldolase RhmA